MHFAIRLPAKLGASLVKWSIIGVFWVGSMFVLTFSAQAIDAISGMWELAGIATVDAQRRTDAKSKLTAEKDKTTKAKKDLEVEKKKVAKSKKDLVAEKKRAIKIKKDLAAEKRLNRMNTAEVRAHGKKIRTYGKKMVGRNLADATTSIIPVIGGFASVTFAVADVHAACELVAMQNELETALGIDSEPSNFKTYCIESINQVNATATEAEKMWINLKENMPDFPDWPTFPDMPDLPDMPDISASELWDDWKCKASFSC
jgi:hypothetical protein